MKHLTFLVTHLLCKRSHHVYSTQIIQKRYKMSAFYFKICRQFSFL